MSVRNLLEMALAFYRQPARFPDLRDPAIPLRGEHEALLRLANGMEVAEAGSVLAGADELRAAARFYVEQVLLAAGADYYRMHGLAPGADDERIREHYRLLMRLLHPDRITFERDWQAAAALRVNQANATLRDPDRRRAYDETLAAATVRAPGVGQASAPPRPVARVRTPLPQRAGDTPLRRFVWRNLPQLSMVGILLLAMAGVGLVWLNESGNRALGAGGEGEVATVVPVDMARHEAKVPAVAARAAPAPVAGSAALPVAVVPSKPVVAPSAPLPPARAPAEPVQSVKPPARVAIQPEPAHLEKVSVAAAAQPVVVPPRAVAPEPVPVQRPEPQPSSAPKEAPATVYGPVERVQTVERLAVSAPPSAGQSALLALPDPTAMAVQFSRRYEQGNIDTFMALFAPDAREDSGGWRDIREDYDDLFKTTTLREIRLSGMVWSPVADGWRGEGQFRARIQRTGESVQRLYAGTLRMELSIDDGKTRIRGLYHKLAGQGVD